jgi:hypothetical protein
MKQFKVQKQKLIDLINQFDDEISENLKYDIIAKICCLTPQVKALEWNEFNSAQQYAITPERINLRIYSGRFILNIYDTPGYEVPEPMGLFNTIEEAQAVAQEHYNNFILGEIK